MSTYENFVQRIRRIYADHGALIDGSEVFSMGPDDPRFEDGNAIEYYRGSLGFLRDNAVTIYGFNKTRWNRVSLTQLFHGIDPVIHIYNPATLSEIVNALFIKYGVPLSHSWVRSSAVDGTQAVQQLPLYVNRNQFVRNQLNDGNEIPLWITVIRPAFDLATIEYDTVTQPVLPYNSVMGYTNTELISYNVDFTPREANDYKLIKAIASSSDLYETELMPGVFRSQALIELLSERLGIPVTLETDVEGALCLNGATFHYNGSSLGYADSDRRYHNVLVFSTILDTDNKSIKTYRGKVYVHYNDVI